MPSNTKPQHRPREWLLLVYQLPAKPSNIRVRTWRRLQQVGAVGLKNSAYVLPNSPQAKEDFAWIKAEIAAMKGQANLFLADHFDAATEEEIAAAFRTAREADFRTILQDGKRLLNRAKHGRSTTPRHQKAARSARMLRERFNNLRAIDFFHAPGRDEAAAVLDEVEKLLAERPGARKIISKPGEKVMVEKFRSRIWVTRPRPGVDRMSSGWLIRRFIDPQAKFAFADKAEEVPDAVPFDMFGAQLSHEGSSCTFETLSRRFGIASPALGRIGQIVHNLDLKDERFDVPEALALGRLVEGLRQIHSDDHKLLEHGMEIFEALYRSLTNTPPNPKASKKKSGRKEPRSFIGLS